MPALSLHTSQYFRLDVFLKERFDFGMEVCAEDAEGDGVALVDWLFNLAIGT